jgi:hypothetical protein
VSQIPCGPVALTVEVAGATGTDKERSRATGKLVIRNRIRLDRRRLDYAGLFYDSVDL